MRERTGAFGGVCEHSLDGVLLLRSDGTILRANPAACRAIGRSEEEICRDGCEKLVVESDRLRDLLGEAATSGPVAGELTFRRSDGGTFPVELTSGLVPSDEGAPLSHLIFRDISARRRAEQERQLSYEALRERAAMLEGLVETIPQPTFLKDRDGRWIFANPATLAAIGKSLEEVQGQTDGEIFSASRIGQTMSETDRRILESGVPEVVEETLQTADGERVFHVSKAPFRDEAGRIVGVVNSARDITGRKRAEEALREREYMFAASQRFAHVGSWNWKIGDSKVWWSDETYRLYGLSPDMGAPDFEFFFEIVHPEDRPKLREWVRTAVAGRHPAAVEFRALRPDGTCRVIRTEGDVIETVDGVPSRIAGTAYDVTDLLSADEAVRESERRYRELFEKSPVALFLSEVISDSAGRPIDCRFLYVNPAFERFVQAKAADLVGRTLFEFNPRTSRAMMERHGRVALTGVPDSWEGHSVALDTHYEATAFSPRPGQCVTFLVDISDRKRAEAALREALERERQAVSAGNVGLWDWDLRSNRVQYSAEWKRQIGYAEDEISDDFDEWRTRVHPEDIDRCLSAVRAFLANPGPKYEVEFRFRHRDGSYRHILARASVVRDEKGRPERMLGSHVDVTERTELQAQFLQAQKMESVGRLAGGLAHDFNNLLTVINGTAELAMRGLQDGDPLREDLDAIDRAGRRAAQLTRQLLAFSRKQVLQPTVLDLNAVIADMQKMLTRLIGEDVTLAFAPTEELGLVRADRGQIEQVLLNLAVNARDAMPGGGTLTISTANVDLDETRAELRPPVVAGRFVMFSVGDTGIGMDQATQNRIFEPFFTTKGVGKGTGLGLSTVYGIVAQSGGHIGVHAEVGKGTSFEIHLPRVAGVAEADRSTPSDSAVRGSETILLVEDDEALRRLTERALESAGYDVLVAANGGEALLLLEEFPGPVHLLLTDVVMPGMSGRDLADRLREMRRDMRVLFCSGYTDDTILHHGVLDDLTNFISKPYTVAALAGKVREVLGR
ncbi:MAG: PAS domain S-box protein [Thermoanaerobaculia bacterium]